MALPSTMLSPNINSSKSGHEYWVVCKDLSHSLNLMLGVYERMFIEKIIKCFLVICETLANIVAGL